MMTTGKTIWGPAAALLLLLAGGTAAFPGGQDQQAGARFAVFVSIPPQAYFVERIGGERVRVEVMVKPGQDPHTFEPTPQQLARLAQAKVFFRIGVEFEHSLVPRMESTMKSLRIVDCREGVRLRQMGPTEQEGENREGEGQHHDEEGLDPHIWMSVRNAERIATTIRDTLVSLDPGGKTVYQDGCRSLEDDLKALDRRLADILAPVRGKPLFVFHPAFGYFAENYGLRQIAVETGGTEPSGRQLAGLIDMARRQGVKVIFVQPQFSRTSAETIAAEIGAAVVPIDPLARDYIENLESIARTVEEALR
jgi:zinc transport system substrate-binding protein